MTPEVAGSASHAPMTLADAVDYLNGGRESSHLMEIETFFLRRLMDDMDSEEKAECYYYLLRCRLRRTRLFESVEVGRLYQKMRDTFLRAETEHVSDARKKENFVARTQLRAFYQLAIYYFGTIENLFISHKFDESARRANIDRMELRRRSYANERKVAHTFGYTLVGLTSRYGNSFVRWGITTLISVLSFASIYILLDYNVIIENRIVPPGDPFFEYFYFSIVTFMTLGYGDILPHTVAQMAVASVEVIMGYFMLGVLINMMHRQN